MVPARCSRILPINLRKRWNPAAAERVRTAVHAGLRKVLARMGVSTIASYRNSQLFEVVGLSEDLCTEFFEDAADFPGQKTLDELLADYLRMHTSAFAAAPNAELGDSGLYRFRKGAELHANSPEIVRRLHAHVKSPGREEIFRLRRTRGAAGNCFPARFAGHCARHARAY